MEQTWQQVFTDQDKQITVLTGAGISAESGIPTFRGPEGYWTVGAREYHPQEMATHAMFSKCPYEVWKWYLYRLGVCSAAEPNQGHIALVEMEQILQDRFTLITQNVDNLHLCAGNSPARTFQIHGNVFFMRCSNECQQRLYPLPTTILPRASGQDLTEEDKIQLSCPDCASLSRPHVLWFDECYDEHYFKFESAIKVAKTTDMLIIAGTFGTTNLPNYIANIVYQNQGMIIDIDLVKNPFAELAINSVNGEFLNMSCSEGLAKLVTAINR